MFLPLFFPVCSVVFLCVCRLTFTAQAAVFVVHPHDPFDDSLIVAVLTLAHDVVDLLKLFRTGQTTCDVHFALCTNTVSYHGVMSSP